MANQRLVMGAIAEKVLSSDVATMAETINAMSSYITTDMSVEDLIKVAESMRGMDMDNGIYSAMNPTYGAQIDGIWYQYCDLAAWRKLMTRVDAGLPPYEDKAQNSNDGGIVGSARSYLGATADQTARSEASGEGDETEEDAGGSRTGASGNARGSAAGGR